jgi:DNA-binding NtrC family response regulator
MGAACEEVSVMSRQDSVEQFPPPYVLVVFPSNEHRTSLLREVANAGMVPLSCHSYEEAQEAMMRENIQVVICEDVLPENARKSILKLARSRARPIPVIVTSRTGEWAEFLTALRQGAFDYLVLPPRCDEVSRVLTFAIAEVSRKDAIDMGSGGTPISDGNSLMLSLDDPLEITPERSQPLILRSQRGTK